jgi:PKD repeat protein
VSDNLSFPSHRRRAVLAVLALAICAACVFGQPVRAEAAPVAGFTFTPSSPSVGETVTFTSTSQAADGATILQHRWDLDGDGHHETNTGTSPTARYTYSEPGTVTVRLRVIDSAAGVDRVSHPVTVTGQRPIASFAFSPGAPVVGQPVLFTSTSSDPDGTIIDQDWDLNGDGNFENGSGATALRSFPAPGSYVVGLRVSDNEGQVAFYSNTVAVAEALGTASRPGLRLLSPFPLVRIAGQIGRRGTRLRLLTVIAPAGAKVTIRCSGRGCPFAKQVRLTARPPRARAAKLVRVRRLERLLRPGVTIKIFVTRPDAIGKYTRFRIRRGTPPGRMDRCLMPGSRRPVRCPAG